jgi:hypothetical protein
MVLATLLEFRIKFNDIKNIYILYILYKKKVFCNLANREFENICCVTMF